MKKVLVILVISLVLFGCRHKETLQEKMGKAGLDNLEAVDAMNYFSKEIQPTMGIAWDYQNKKLIITIPPQFGKLKSISLEYE